MYERFKIRKAAYKMAKIKKAIRHLFKPPLNQLNSEFKFNLSLSAKHPS
jgi:hypothetical protein